MKFTVSSSQVVSSTVPGRKNISHGARAIAAASRSRCASGADDVSTLQPATSATSSVPSVEPPSAMVTSRTMPLMAAGTSMARVGTRARSLSKVGMTTLNIEESRSKQSARMSES